MPIERYIESVIEACDELIEEVNMPNKEFRPKGWKNPYIDKHTPHTDSWERLCYERGASAMFNALRQEGNSKGGRVENDEFRGKGTWLFMPDEEKDADTAE